ncbi:MAG: transcription termination factor NusA [Candidatus Calescibacterium sp.]|nr:transcription termination factor NusA [Candidatus Calescibacterium sp.]MDW8086697.1 transcription termination factor NusA [Candidatus Calescibacterium sp.]
MARKIELKIKETPAEPIKISLKSICEERDVKKEKIVEYLKDILKTVATEIKGKGNYEVYYDDKNDTFRLMRRKVVVSELTDPENEIHIDEALKVDPSAEVGDEALEEIPFESLGRRGAARAKFLLEKLISEGTEETIFEEYSKKKGMLITGIVKKIEFDRITRKKVIYVDLGRNHVGILLPEETLPHDSAKLREGDSVKAVIKDVRKREHGRAFRTEIILSRTDNKFLEEIVKKNVTEVEQGIIKIRAIARKPGSRSKIMVYSDDPSVDPVGTCVGVKGIRIKNIVQELGGERVDIIPWDADTQKLVMNALGVNKVTAMFLTKVDSQREAIVVVPDDILALAVGRGGINVKLASELLGIRIRVRSESERERIKEMLPDFFQKIGITDKQAQIMWDSGIKTIEDIALGTYERLVNVPGLTEQEAKRIWQEARKLYFEKLREEKPRTEEKIEENFIKEESEKFEHQ